MKRKTERTKYNILICMLFDLLRERQVNAAALAAKYGVSTRSIHRYVEELSVAGVPVFTKQGRNGGLCIPSYYKLPVGFFGQEEYAAIKDALVAAKGEREDSRYARVLKKLIARADKEQLDLSVSGNLLVDGTAWGDVYTYSDHLNQLESALDAHLCIQIDYVTRQGERSARIVEPHLLVLKQNIWYIYAYCRTRKDFRLFRLSRIAKLSFTGEKFVRKPFTRSDIPLHFASTQTSLIELKLSLTQESISEVIDWLGIDSVDEKQMLAKATVPDDQLLIHKLLSLGGSVLVLSPSSIGERLVKAATQVAALYS